MEGAGGHPAPRRGQRSATRLLDESQAIEFGRLYRCAASDLNQAQTFVRGDATVQYLNDLVARCYLVIYTKTSVDLWGLLRYLFWGYPAVFRRNLRPVMLATALFFAGFLLGFLASYYDRESRSLFAARHAHHPARRGRRDAGDDQRRGFADSSVICSPITSA